MRRHKILIWTFLILSIINFALAAPVTVRERPEVRLGAKAKATGGVTVVSQKRGPFGESGSTNIPGLEHGLPPSPDSADIWSQIGYIDNPLPTPDSLGSLLRSGHVPPNPELPTGSRLTEGSIPVAGPPSPPPESWSPNALGSDHTAPPPLAASPHLADTFSQIAEQHRYTDNSLPPMDSPESLAGSQLPVESTSVASSLSLPPPLESWSVPGSVHAPLQSPDLADILSQAAEHYGYTGSTRPPDISLSSSTGSRLPVAGSHSLSPPLESWSSDAPGSDYAPLPNTGLTHTFSQTAEQMSEQHEYTDSLRLPPDNLGSSTGSHLSVGSMPVANSHLLSPPLESWSPEVVLGSDYRPPPSPDLTDILLRLAEQMPEHHGYDNSPQPPPDNHFPSPPSSSVNPDALSSVGSTGDLPIPTPPQSPGVDPEIHSLIEPESFPNEFWESFLKGKFKRHISDSGVVNLG